MEMTPDCSRWNLPYRFGWWLGCRLADLLWSIPATRAYIIGRYQKKYRNTLREKT